MSRSQLTAAVRNETGTTSARQLKAAHKIPAVLYGPHIEPKHIAIDEASFIKFHHHHGVGASLDLDIDGEKVFAIVKDMQADPITQNTIHIDFQALSAGEAIKLHVPIHLLNRNKLDPTMICQELMADIEISVLPKDLIEHIDLDLMGVEIGDQYKVKDLPEMPGITILSDPDSVIYTIQEAKVYDEEEEAEEEVILAEDVPLVE